MHIMSPSACMPALNVSCTTRYLAARGIWNALQTPVLHLAEAAIVAELLPLIEEGAPLTRPGVDVTHLEKHFNGIPYTGVYRTFMRSGALCGELAARRVLETIEEDATHWCHPIWEGFAAYHPYFVSLERQVRPYKRTYDPKEEFLDTVIDASSTALGVVGPALKALAGTGPLNAGRVRRLLLPRAEELSWGASTRREADIDTVEILPDQTTPPKNKPFRQSTDPEVPIWHNSLANGPWRTPGHCPANTLLTFPEPQTRQETDALFVAAQRESGHMIRHIERPPGAARAAELRIIVASYMLAEAIDS
jgi:hypothetical protein